MSKGGSANSGQTGQLSWNAGGSHNQNFNPESFNKQLGSDIQATYSKGPSPIFQKSLYTGFGDVTKGAQSDVLDFSRSAADGSYGLGISGATDYLSDTAAGNRIGMQDPGYREVRDKVESDTLSGVSSLFSNMGRYGGGSHVQTATDELGATLGRMDMGQYNQSLDRQIAASQLLPSLYQAGMAPSATALQIGQTQDADALAKRQAEYELFNRTSDPNFTHIAKHMSLLGQQSANPQPEEQPGLFDWLSLGIGGASLFL